MQKMRLFQDFLFDFYKKKLYICLVLFTKCTVERRRFYLPLPHLAPSLGLPRSNFIKMFSVRKLDSLGCRVTLLS